MSAQKLGCRLKSLLQKEVIFVAMFISTTNNILYNVNIIQYRHCYISNSAWYYIYEYCFLFILLLMFSGK